jgi:FkbM family methyltransferase
MSRLTKFYRKCLLQWHKPRHWQLRPGTIDGRIFRDVVAFNEYGLPRHFNPGDVVVDVGAHVGSFAYAALRRGAGRVYCCEANAQNFQLLWHNLRPYQDRVLLQRAAVWRSDTNTPTLYYAGPDDRRNTGGGKMTDLVTDQEVPTLALDDLLRQATEGRRRVRLLKLDCEGAEWPILLTSRLLGHVDALCGEYHLEGLPAAYGVAGYPAFTPAVLQTYLQRQGFQVQLTPMPDDPSAGLFFGTRAAAAARAA